MKPIQHAACLCALSALLALSPAVALCENTPAENQQAEDSQLQTGKQANLRKLPNKKSDKLETLKKGSVLTVISVSEINGENWAYVRVQSGREGYILYELLEPVPTPTPEPTATPTPTPSPVPTATPEPGSETPAPTAEPSGVKDEIAYDEPRLVRTLKRANLRKKPAGSRLGEIAANTALTVVGEVEKDGELWLHVEKGKDHREGYMLSELVRQVKPVELIPITEGEVRALFPVIGRDPIADIKNEIPFTYTEEELAQYHTLDVAMPTCWRCASGSMRWAITPSRTRTRCIPNPPPTSSRCSKPTAVWRKPASPIRTRRRCSLTTACSPARAARRRSPTCQTRRSR